MICSVCQAIFGDNCKATRVQAGPVTPFTYPHYSSGELLLASVNAGCQTCNLMWHRMFEDARLEVMRGYKDGWTLEPSMVGSIWYSIIANESIVKTDVLTIYMTYGYGPNEIPTAVAASGDYPDTMVAKTAVGTTIALYVSRANREQARSPQKVGPFLLSLGFIELANIDTPSSSTDSDRTWQLVQSWFKECKNSHPACSHKINKPHWQPTRLLSVGTAGNPSIHLQINNPNSAIEAYVSLSHCWGKIKILRLLKSNIEAFQMGISELELPKTFQEAISITRRLGYGFLWIDSLCIIQDSTEDWRQEAAIMGDVYRNAAFNIAATKSSDGSQGCFAKRNPILIQPCYVEAKWEWGAGQYQIHDSALWRHGVTRAPLNTRAWAIQEMSLAKRVLHFGKDQLFWECDQKMACETFPSGIPITQIEVTPRINSFFFDGQGDQFRLRCFSEEWFGMLKPELNLKYYDLWANVVSAYTKCQLTQPTDKLIALSGLAKEFKALTGDEYMAGLWRRHLPHHLLWFIEKPIAYHTSPSQSQPYYAPSWSWASTMGEVMDHPVTSLPGEQILIEIVDVQVNTATSDTTGECTGGYLKLRGLLKPLSWKWIEEDELYSLFLEESQLDFSIAFPDSSNYATSDIVFCLPVQMFEVDEGEPRLYGLVLKIVEQKSNTFRRVGQFKVDYDHCSSIADTSLERKDIIII